MKAENSTAVATMAQEQVKNILTYEEIKEQYGAQIGSEPAVYCGTYAKYNEGSLFGLWLDLTKFYDYEEFIDVCRQLHEDEHDPELMFQDYENFPRVLYCESCMGEETFNKIIEYTNLSDAEKEAFDEYLDIGHEFDIDAFTEAYMGKYDSERDFAEHIVNEIYDLERMMGNLHYYFDYDAYARDLFADGFEFSEGYVFRSY